MNVTWARPWSRTGKGDAARVEIGTLLLSIVVIAICALTYELLVGSLSSYLLGNSITFFSLTIGAFMTAMGLGSFLSRWCNGDLLRWFIGVELAIAVLGGFSVFILYAAFATSPLYYVAMFSVIGVVGALIGLEIPLLTRIARDYGPLRSTLANVLGFDYIGALVASILFPLVLLPNVGLMKTSFLMGLLNLAVVLGNLWIFRKRLSGVRTLTVASVLGLALLGGGFFASVQATSFFEHRLYQDEIIYSEQTPYQRIVMTQWNDDLRLYLDGAIQFSSRDEYRYHETFVHPAMSLVRNKERVLILGGGDGLVSREVLKYADVRQVDLVDIDPAVTNLAKSFPPLLRINQNALNDPRLRVLNEDAFTWLDQNADLYGLIFVDMPDPRNESLSKLFSLEFYRLTLRHLERGGLAVVQSTSPYYSRETFWGVTHTLQAAGATSVVPYHTNIPTFGDWGFNIAGNMPFDLAKIDVQVPVRYATTDTVSRLFSFDPDTSEVPAPVSTLEDQAALRSYIAAWRQWRSK